MAMNIVPYLENSSTGKLERQKSTSGAAHVSDVANPSGILRTRLVGVTTDAVPLEGTADRGVITYQSPGVTGIVINSVTVISGTPPVAANTNYTVRYAIDAASDDEDAILLPATFPSRSATADLGQIGSFNLKPVMVTTAAGGAWLALVTLEHPIYIDVTDPIRRLSFAHNIGGSVILAFNVSAVEEV